MNTCDNWVVLKIQPEASGEQEVFYKLLQGFSGSYTYGNSWHMNSGIEKVELNDGLYEVHGYSGSVHKVREGSYGVRLNIAEVIAYYDNNYPNCIKVMPDCDWSEFKWSTKNEDQSI